MKKLLQIQTKKITSIEYFCEFIKIEKVDNQLIQIAKLWFFFNNKVLKLWTIY